MRPLILAALITLAGCTALNPGFVTEGTTDAATSSSSGASSPTTGSGTATGPATTGPGMTSTSASTDPLTSTTDGDTTMMVATSDTTSGSSSGPAGSSSGNPPSCMTPPNDDMVPLIELRQFQADGLDEASCGKYGSLPFPAKFAQDGAGLVFKNLCMGSPAIPLIATSPQLGMFPPLAGVGTCVSVTASTFFKDGKCFLKALSLTPVDMPNDVFAWGQFESEPNFTYQGLVIDPHNLDPNCELLPICSPIEGIYKFVLNNMSFAHEGDSYMPLPLGMFSYTFLNLRSHIHENCDPGSEPLWLHFDYFVARLG